MIFMTFNKKVMLSHFFLRTLYKWGCDGNSGHFTYKWGCDGNSGHFTYKKISKEVNLIHQMKILFADGINPLQLTERYIFW